MDLDDKSLLGTKGDSWDLASTVCHSPFARTEITRQQVERSHDSLWFPEPRQKPRNNIKNRFLSY